MDYEIAKTDGGARCWTPRYAILRQAATSARSRGRCSTSTAQASTPAAAAGRGSSPTRRSSSRTALAELLRPSTRTQSGDRIGRSAWCAPVRCARTARTWGTSSPTLRRRHGDRCMNRSAVVHACRARTRRERRRARPRAPRCSPASVRQSSEPRARARGAARTLAAAATVADRRPRAVAIRNEGRTAKPDCASPGHKPGGFSDKPLRAPAALAIVASRRKSSNARRG